MGNLVIRDLLKQISEDFDTENADFANFMSITNWDAKRISIFFDKRVNSKFDDEEYHALGYFLFVHPGEGAQFKDKITSAGKTVIEEFKKNNIITIEQLKIIKQNHFIQ